VRELGAAEDGPLLAGGDVVHSPLEEVFVVAARPDERRVVDPLEAGLDRAAEVDLLRSLVDRFVGERLLLRRFLSKQRDREREEDQ
jgi:hypothetical protein